MGSFWTIPSPGPGSVATGAGGPKTVGASAEVAIGSGECGADYLLRAQLTSYPSVAVDIGGVRHIAASASPREGYFWRILQVDAVDTDSNLQYIAFALAPSAGLPTTNALDPLSTVIADAYARLRNSIRLSGGHDVSSLSDTTTIAAQSGGSCGPFDLSPMILLPGFSLIAFEVNAAVSGIAHRLILRVLFVEVPFGTDIPF